MSLVLGLEYSCPWPRECLSSERLSLALASDFFCVLGLGLGLEPCVLDSTSVRNTLIHHYWPALPSMKTSWKKVIKVSDLSNQLNSLDLKKLRKIVRRNALFEQHQ